eukprot:1062306-Pyramimonas_sp.AAC.1
MQVFSFPLHAIAVDGISLSRAAARRALHALDAGGPPTYRRRQASCFQFSTSSRASGRVVLCLLRVLRGRCRPH